MWQEVRNVNLAKREKAMAAARLDRASYVKATPKLADHRRYSVTQLALFDLNPEDFAWVEKNINKLPRMRQREHFRGLYLEYFKNQKGDHNKKRYCANTYLRTVLNYRLNKAFARCKVDVSFLLAFRDEDYFNQIIKKEIKKTKKHGFKKLHNLPFYLLSAEKIKTLSDDLAFSLTSFQVDYISSIFEHQQKQGKTASADDINEIMFNLYQISGRLCEKMGLTIPYWERLTTAKKFKNEWVDIALNKITCPRFWLKTLTKLQKKMVEHIAIATGEVNKKITPYLSNDTFFKHLQQIKKNYDFLKNMILVNAENEEEQYELLAMIKRSSSFPIIRQREMMNRIRGVDEWATENGVIPLFLTLTAPSAFHSSLSCGGVNPKWNGASPRDTQAYLNKVWQQLRALYKKRGVSFFGLRVVEPHHDGTPHWHFLLFVKAEDKETAINLFKNKALELDGNETGASLHRCKVEECDPKKGSAVGYIAKYIGKNLGGIDSEAISDESETLSLKDNAKRVAAWASCWRVRQFQFYGCSSVSVWRELRRLELGKCEDDETLEKAQVCADVGDFAAYLDQMGGAFASRKQQPIKLIYKEKEANKYGEICKSVCGVVNAFNGVAVISRRKRFIIRRKDQINPTENGAELGGNKQNRSPWTCVTNCNRLNFEQNDEKKQNLETSSELLPKYERQAEKLRQFLH